MKSPEAKALAAKIVLFSSIGILFWLLTPNAGLATYAILVVLAVVWAIYETVDPKKRQMIGRAVTLGLFLMAFDFIVENLGFFSGLWTSPQSMLTVISVPIEIMALTFVGGYAWAMHLPQKSDRTYIILESLVFGFFGALGEYLLILNGMMVYMNGWTSVHAFTGYLVTWLILFVVWYRAIRKSKI